MNFLKSANKILTSLITWVSTGTKKITDFSVGSAIRTILEAVALQLEEFYFNLHQAVEHAIESSAYHSFDFDKEQASNATGFILVTFKNQLPQSITIRAGTLFSTPPSTSPVIYYETLEDVVIIEGMESASLPVRCTVSGTIGNLPPNSVTNMVNSNVYIDSVTNTMAFVGGTDEETSVARKARFKEYVKSLQRGTKEAIAYGTKSVPGVAGAWVDDNYIGFVRVYAHDSDGNLPDTLKSEILEVLEDYRAGGIEVEVLPVVTVNTDLTLNLVLEDHTYIDSIVFGVKGLVENYLNNLQVSENLYLSNLITLITSNYKGAVVNIEVLNGNDTNLQHNELIKSGIVSITGVHVSDWEG